MSHNSKLDELLAHDGPDSGCAASFQVLHRYVEAELAGDDPGHKLPGVATHVRRCPACRADYLGLLEALREFGDAAPEGDLP